MKRVRSEFHDQVNATWEYINPAGGNDMLTRFGYLPGSHITAWITGDFQSALEKYNAAYTIWDNPAWRAKVHVETLKTATSELGPLYRHLHALFKNNMLVTDSDLIHMHIPPRTRVNDTPVSPPMDIPLVNVKCPLLRVVDIYFGNAGSPRGGKPRGTRCAWIAWAILDQPPVNIDELTNVNFATRPPLRLVFEEEERGKCLYLVVRWENTRGKHGPWSNIFKAIIP
jgi:hypothetical protein